MFSNFSIIVFDYLIIYLYMSCYYKFAIAKLFHLLSANNQCNYVKKILDFFLFLTYDIMNYLAMSKLVLKSEKNNDASIH